MTNLRTVALALLACIGADQVLWIGIRAAVQSQVEMPDNSCGSYEPPTEVGDMPDDTEC